MSLLVALGITSMLSRAIVPSMRRPVGIATNIAASRCDELASGQKTAVNLLPRQFQNEDLAGEVSFALNQSGLDAGRLELEITESLLLQDSTSTLATLHRIRELGVSMSVDDLGTGYSALSYLRRFPLNKIKIDQSFIRRLGDANDCIAIVRAVVGLGQSLGMPASHAAGIIERFQISEPNPVIGRAA